jgi:hypothetical protein
MSNEKWKMVAASDAIISPIAIDSDPEESSEDGLCRKRYTWNATSLQVKSYVTL